MFLILLSSLRTPQGDCQLFWGMLCHSSPSPPNPMGMNSTEVLLSGVFLTFFLTPTPPPAAPQTIALKDLNLHALPHLIDKTEDQCHYAGATKTSALLSDAQGLLSMLGLRRFLAEDIALPEGSQCGGTGCYCSLRGECADRPWSGKKGKSQNTDHHAFCAKGQEGFAPDLTSNLQNMQTITGGREVFSSDRSPTSPLSLPLIAHGYTS